MSIDYNVMTHVYIYTGGSPNLLRDDPQLDAIKLQLPGVGDENTVSRYVILHSPH